MDASFILKGIVLGFSIAAPVGPIGVLCIQLTLEEGRLYGLVAGLGAATADAMYGLVAGFGLTFISSFLVDQQLWLRLFGGLFLCYLGVKTLLAQPAQEAAGDGGRSMGSAYLSVAALTLTNPLTILMFTAVFAGLGLSVAGTGYGGAAVFVLGVFTGSALWWLLLSGSVSLLQHRFTARSLQWVNRGSGLIILGFGVVALWGMVR